MVNIPGILGTVTPGAFSRIIFRANVISPPGGPRVPTIVGLGQREEVLVYEAQGSCLDGLGTDYTLDTSADGRHFQVAHWPIVAGQLRLFRNGIELIQSPNTIDDTSPYFLGGTQYMFDASTGRVLLAPAAIEEINLNTSNTRAGTVDCIQLGDCVPYSETFTFEVVSINANNRAVFSVNGSKSGQIFGAEFAEEGEISYVDKEAIQVFNSQGNLITVDPLSFGNSDSIFTGRATNFFNRDIQLCGCNMVSSTDSKFYVRIFGSKITDLADSEVAFTPGEALYETSDDLTYDPVTKTWSGTWYRGVDGTGLVTTEFNSLGCSGADKIYTSAGVDTGISINWTGDLTADSDGDGFADGDLDSDGSIDAGLNDPDAYYEAIYGYADPQGVFPGDPDSPVNLAKARLTGFAKGDMWEVSASGSYDNGILRLGIVGGSQDFTIGDSINVTVSTGVLQSNDRLTAAYVAVADINAPEVFQNAADLFSKHGTPSAANTLSMGALISFENGASQIVAVQGKPLRAERTTEVLMTSNVSDNNIATGGSKFTAHITHRDMITDDVSHVASHAGSAGNGKMTTLHSHSSDPSHALSPDPIGGLSYVRITGDPEMDSINLFRLNQNTGKETQVFYTQVSLGDVKSDVASNPCFVRHGIDCNKSGRDENGPLDDTVPNEVNNPYYLDPADNNTYFLKVYSPTVIWVEIADPTNEIGSPSEFSLYGPTLVRPVFATGETSEVAPLFSYSNNVRTYFRTLYDDVIQMFAAIRNRTVYPCALRFQELHIGDKVNGNLIENGPPTPSLNENTTVFYETCTDNYDPIVGQFLKTAFNGTQGDPFRIDIEDAKSHMKTRGDFSYMVWSNGEVILSDEAGLGAGEGLKITYITQEDANFVDSNWFEAASSLEKRDDVYFIVPIPDRSFAGVQATFRTHIDKMSSIRNKRERFLLTGAATGLGPLPLINGALYPIAIEDVGRIEGIQGDDLAEIATGNVEDRLDYSIPSNFGLTHRVQYFWPDEIVKEFDGSTYTLNGNFIAAAASGFYAAQGFLADSLTNKTLIGFTINPNKILDPDTANALAGAGVTIVKPLAAGGRVVWSKSTTSSGVAEKEEVSITNVIDFIQRQTRAAMTNSFIGRPIEPDTPAQMVHAMKTLMSSYVRQKMINSFNHITVTQDRLEPRQMNITADLLPVFPLNWIYIEFSLSLVGGGTL